MRLQSYAMLCLLHYLFASARLPASSMDVQIDETLSKCPVTDSLRDIHEGRLRNIHEVMMW